MGFRFQKRIKIAPGIHINLSKGGTSFSVGGRGATVNFGGKKGARATVGIPGTGLSYSSQLSQSSNSGLKNAGNLGASESRNKYFFLALFVVVILVTAFGVVAA